jgi:hypothetical protein
VPTPASLRASPALSPLAHRLRSTRISCSSMLGLDATPSHLRARRSVSPGGGRGRPKPRHAPRAPCGERGLQLAGQQLDAAVAGEPAAAVGAGRGREQLRQALAQRRGGRASGRASKLQRECRCIERGWGRHRSRGALAAATAAMGGERGAVRGCGTKRGAARARACCC